MTGIPTYPDCAHINKPVATLTVTEDIAEHMALDFRVLPIFEKSLYEFSYKRYYSLNTNEFLKCRWKSYVKHFETREFTPFYFVDIRDFHFYNSRNRLVPNESIHTKRDFRLKLKAGPGVDFRGQMPIPDEFIMKRGTKKSKTEGKRYSHPENKENVEEGQV